MTTRTSSAEWKGTLKEGAGTMSLGSGSYTGPFTFASRFENGKGTNPEDLRIVRGQDYPFTAPSTNDGANRE